VSGADLSNAVSSPGRIAGVVGALGAAVALGAALGVAAERVVVHRALRPDPERDEPFGALRGRVVPVVASDGTALHVEVEDPPPGSVAERTGDGLTIIFCHGYALEQDSWHYQRRDLRALVVPGVGLLALPAQPRAQRSRSGRERHDRPARP
jgi:hypothetical protein